MTPLELIDRAVAIASRPDVDLLLVRRHAPGAGLARRPAEGEGARRRRAHRLLAARRAAAGAPAPATARSSSSRWASRPPPPPTPWPCTGRRRRASPTSPCSWPTCSCRPRSRRCSSCEDAADPGPARPRPRLRRHRLPRLRAAWPRSYRIPIVVTGFEPLDLLRGVLAAVHAARARRGAGGEPVPAGGACARATPPRCGCSRTSSWSPTAAGGASARSPGAATPSRRSTRAFDAERVFDVGGLSVERARGVPGRPRAAGAPAAHGLPRVRHALHARAPAGGDHGLVRGGLRRLLPLPPTAGASRGGGEVGHVPLHRLDAHLPGAAATTATSSSSPTAAGARKTARLIETLFAPAFRNPYLEPLGRRRGRARWAASGSPSPPTPSW